MCIPLDFPCCLCCIVGLPVCVCLCISFIIVYTPFSLFVCFVDFFPVFFFCVWTVFCLAIIFFFFIILYFLIGLNILLYPKIKPVNSSSSSSNSNSSSSSSSSSSNNSSSNNNNNSSNNNNNNNNLSLPSVPSHHCTFSTHLARCADLYKVVTVKLMKTSPPLESLKSLAGEGDEGVCVCCRSRTIINKVYVQWLRIDKEWIWTKLSVATFKNEITLYIMKQIFFSLPLSKIKNLTTLADTPFKII